MKLFIDASISSLDSQFNSIEPHQDICYMINDYVHADSAAVYIKVLNTSSDRSVVVVIVIVVIVIVIVIVVCYSKRRHISINRTNQ